MEVLALKMKNNIKELRKARGLRQEDMAKLLGVSRQTIVAMENDKYDPTLELAIKTARLLEQPVESIFFLDEKLRIENGEWRMKNEVRWHTSILGGQWMPLRVHVCKWFGKCNLCVHFPFSIPA